MALDFDVSLLVILGGGRTILLKHLTRQPSKETLVRLSQGSNQETKLQVTAQSRQKCALSSIRLAQHMLYPYQFAYNLHYLLNWTLHYHDAKFNFNAILFIYRFYLH